MHLGGMAFVGVILVGLYFVLTNTAPAPVKSGLQTVKDLVHQATQNLTKAATKPEEPPPPPPALKPASTGKKAVPKPVSAAPTPAPEPAGPSAPAPAAAAAPAPAPVTPEVVTAPNPLAGASLYLPGHVSSWTPTDLTVDAPLALRAAGVVSMGTDASGPRGLTASNYERVLSRTDASPSANERALPSAPYLALIGRICSREGCSVPFPIGTRTVVCPEDLSSAGQLQLWTNNYVRISGTQTVSSYSEAAGGYWLYAERDPGATCSRPPAPGTATKDPNGLAPGPALRRSEFRVSSSEVSWKPFFLLADGPLVIRASGAMRPRGGSAPTGPEGIAVPAGPEWHYPGSRAVVVDADHQLFDPSLPYQALIGRLCGPTDCGPAFLVGREHTICPAPPRNDRLELWVNHIISPRGFLGTQTPLTMATFDLQFRTGEYHFEVSEPPSGACGTAGPSGPQPKVRGHKIF
jgi:hypothetical protein